MLIFWGTYDGQEKLFAFETKWSTTKPAKLAAIWNENYPNSDFTVMTPENSLNHIT